MQSRMERLDVRKDDLARIMGNFIQVLLSVEFTNTLFKNQQTSTIAEVALKFRNVSLVSQHRRIHVAHRAQTNT